LSWEPGLEKLTQSTDFFAMSSCRDLLFHTHEQCTTLPDIDRFLDESGLMLLGFDVDAAALQAYKHRFPDDSAGTDLKRWHIFELENPDTFSDMYQFWIQKPF